MTLSAILLAAALHQAGDIPDVARAASPADVQPSPLAPPTGECIGYLPRGLTSFGAVASGGWLYVLGGYFGTPHEYSAEGQSGAFMQINLLDPRDMRLLPDVQPVQGAELVASGHTLIRVGGMHAQNAAGDPSVLVSSDEVSAFNTLSGEWSPLPALPTPLSSHRVVAVGTEVHVLGGWTMNGSPKDAEWNARHFTLDLHDETPRWSAMDLPFRARALGAATDGLDIITVGGIAPDRSISPQAWRFDGKARSWSAAPEFPDWGFGVSATKATAGGPPAVFAAGRGGTLYRLARGDSEWAPAGKLRHGRIFHQLVSETDGSVVSVGGIVGMGTQGRVRALERILPKAAETAPVEAPSQRVDRRPKVTIERVSVPFPGSSRNRFGLLARGRSLYMFGGNRSLAQHDFEPEDFAADCWRFDLGSLSWAALAPLPAPRQTMQAATTDAGAVLVVGGFGHDGEQAVTQGGTWTYDFEFDDWSQGPPLAGTRSQFGLAHHGEAFWVFGGLDYDPARPMGAAFDHRMDVLHWDGAQASFGVSDVRLPRKRRAFAGAVLGDRYYMVGGMQDGFALVEGSDVFNFESQAWESMPNPRAARVGADLVAIGDHLYLVGGSSVDPESGELRSDPSVERFDPKLGRWSVVVDDLGMEMKHARAFGVDGRLGVASLHRGGLARLELLLADVDH